MSEIERLLVAAIVSELSTHEFTAVIHGRRYQRHQDLIELGRQVQVDSYRIDIMVSAVFAGRTTVRLAVECDGHEFHDRTKQQAAYDRARDRELLVLGIPTVRFTGSEITHSQERCARDVWLVMRRLMNESVSHLMAELGADDVELELTCLLASHPGLAKSPDATKALWMMTNQQLSTVCFAIRGGSPAESAARYKVHPDLSAYILCGRYADEVDIVSKLAWLADRLRMRRVRIKAATAGRSR